MKKINVITETANEATTGPNDELTDIDTGTLTVICGANTQPLKNMLGSTVAEIRKNLREVLNIGDDHTVVMVNGEQISDENVMLGGNEEVEFKKVAGRKG